MTTTTTLIAPATRQRPLRSGTGRPVWKTGAVAGASASVATFAFAALARAVDVPLRVAGAAIPLVGFAEITFVASIIGTVLAAVLSRRANRPRHAFLITTLALTMAS